uniref:SJCHGC00860 protein n=1 Tax=Schistosoma japonicum TaxID=6182 RepID=Q5DBK5_SCHJA|nr:SJCHGC00860 protein [Schistosoma japonicum]
MPEYRKLLNETCKLFLSFVNEKVPQSTYGGECTNANFNEAPQDGSYSRVNAELRLIYKYSDNPQIQTDRLQDDLNDREEFITSESSFVAYNPTFTVKIEKLFIPISELQTTPPPTTAKNDAGKKDDDDNGGEDSKAPIDTSAMTASGNKGKKDDDDNGGEDSKAPIDTSAMTASGNKGKKDDDDNGGEDSKAPIDTSAMTASGNKGKKDDDDNGGEDSKAPIDTSAMTASGSKDERSTWTIIGIIHLVVLIFVVIGGGITMRKMLEQINTMHIA